MGSRIFATLLALVVGSSAVVAAPFPIVQTRANETRPQVAYDGAHDRYLVVWDTGSGVAGRLFHADGAPVAAAFPILWNASGVRYGGPSVAFKSHLDRFYVAAIRTDEWRARTDVVLRVFEADGRPVGSFPFQVYSGRWGVNLPANLDVEADSYGTNCCLLVAWEDEASKQVFAALVDETPAVVTGPLVVAGIGPSDSTRYANIAAVYWRSFDRYLVTYEENPDFGSNQVVARMMNGYGGGLHAVFWRTPLATFDSRDVQPVARPRAAFNAELGIFLVTWFDRAPARVYGKLVDTDGPTPIPYGGLLTIAGPGRALEAGVPVATGPATHFAVYLPEPLAGGSALTVGYHVVEGATPTVTRRVLSNTGATRRGGAYGAYSPVQESALAVWHEHTSPFTNADDVWGALDSPP